MKQGLSMKFNTNAVTKTTNLAGGQSFTQKPQLELISLLLTSFVHEAYYESASDNLLRLKSLMEAIPDKQFIAKAAIFARTQCGMRSITHALIGHLVTMVKGQPWLKNAIAAVISRPDDILEIVAFYYQLHSHLPYKKGLPAALRKGIAQALTKLSAYQLAKYRGNNKSVKMVDIFNIVHPKPNPEQQDSFKQLMTNTLKATDTWEYKLSRAGTIGTDEDEVQALKSQCWHELLASKQIGYFALLRNLRNIILQAPASLPLAYDLLTNPSAIKQAKVLPFRFLTAAQEIAKLVSEHTPKTVAVINTALEISLSNVPTFPGKILVALDCSGSMKGRPLEIGSLFAAALAKSNNADLMLFSEKASYLSPSHCVQNSLTKLAQIIESNAVYGGTNFNAIFEHAYAYYDRIFILSDMQAWMGNNTPTQTFERYKKIYNANPHIYSIDLQGYGTLQFPENRIYCIAGFSEKIFDVMKYCEKSPDHLIDLIQAIEISIKE